MPEETKYSTGKYWILFLLSVVAFVLFLIFLTPFFWVTLPFVLLFFVAATRMI